MLVCGCVLLVLLTACSGDQQACSEESGDRGGDHSGLDDSPDYATDEELCPAHRGEPPPGLPGTAADGTREYFKTPEPTPELIEWSDWCFFEVPYNSFTAAYDCAGVYSSMAVALELLGMDQQCVLAQSRARIEALTSISGVSGGLQRAQAKSNHGWHLCPSAADPDPTDGRSLTQRCASVPELVEWMDSTYEGGCAQWAQEQQQVFEEMLTYPRESRCVLAHSLLIRWVLAVQGERSGYLWRC